MVENKTKIGIFDSGIGGVTVLKKCLQLVSDFEYIYYSDSLHNPYGDKTKEEVLEIVSRIVTFLLKENCSIIVIACNTASAICVHHLRKKYPDIIFIAIEPAVKLAYDCDHLGGTLIMATKGTMDSEKFHLLYKQYHRDNFYLLSCVGLANLIERGDQETLLDYLKDNLIKYKGTIDVVVLGCTHYPLIKKEIVSVLGDVSFYDGGEGVAKQLKRIIEERGLVGMGHGIQFLDSTGSIEKEKRFFKILEEYDE